VNKLENLSHSCVFLSPLHASSDLPCHTLTTKISVLFQLEISQLDKAQLRQDYHKVILTCQQFTLVTPKVNHGFCHDRQLVNNSRL